MKSYILKGILALCTILLFFCCSKSNSDSSNGNTPPPSGGSNSNSISIANMSFGPSSTTVNKGTSVSWTNNDYTTHTVSSDNNSFNSGNLSYGGTFSHKFSDTGTFTYHCSIHPDMTGSVVVQ